MFHLRRRAVLPNRLDSRHITNIPRQQALHLGQPWWHRAESWLTRRIWWLLPLAIALTVAMKLAFENGGL